MVQKSIIIDFDHTIGYFNQFIFLINIIEKTYLMSLNEQQIHSLLDYFPLVFRPKLYDIFELILLYEKDNQLTFFILYTRNDQPHFVNSIVRYLEQKLKETFIFHHILFEPTKVKQIDTIIPYIQDKQTHILCFIDNTYFDYRDKQVQTKYIKSEHYMYEYNIQDIIAQFPFHLFQDVNDSLLTVYFQNQKKRKHKKKRMLPYAMYELNSSFMIQSIRDFMQSQYVL